MEISLAFLKPNNQRKKVGFLACSLALILPAVFSPARPVAVTATHTTVGDTTYLQPLTGTSTAVDNSQTPASAGSSTGEDNTYFMLGGFSGSAMKMSFINGFYGYDSKVTDPLVTVPCVSPFDTTGLPRLGVDESLLGSSLRGCLFNPVQVLGSSTFSLLSISSCAYVQSSSGAIASFADSANNSVAGSVNQHFLYEMSSFNASSNSTDSAKYLAVIHWGTNSTGSSIASQSSDTYTYLFFNSTTDSMSWIQRSTSSGNNPSYNLYLFSVPVSVAVKYSAYAFAHAVTSTTSTITKANGNAAFRALSRPEQERFHSQAVLSGGSTTYDGYTKTVYLGRVKYEGLFGEDETTTNRTAFQLYDAPTLANDFSSERFTGFDSAHTYDLKVGDSTYSKLAPTKDSVTNAYYFPFNGTGDYPYGSLIGSTAQWRIHDDIADFSSAYVSLDVTARPTTPSVLTDASFPTLTTDASEITLALSANSISYTAVAGNEYALVKLADSSAFETNYLSLDVSWNTNGFFSADYAGNPVSEATAYNIYSRVSATTSAPVSLLSTGYAFTTPSALLSSQNYAKARSYSRYQKTISSASGLASVAYIDAMKATIKAKIDAETDASLTASDYSAANLASMYAFALKQEQTSLAVHAIAVSPNDSETKTLALNSAVAAIDGADYFTAPSFDFDAALASLHQTIDFDAIRLSAKQDLVTYFNDSILSETTGFGEDKRKQLWSVFDTHYQKLEVVTSTDATSLTNACASLLSAAKSELSALLTNLKGA